MMMKCERWAIIERRRGVTHIAFPRPNAGEGDPAAPLLFSTQQAANRYIQSRWGWVEARAKEMPDWQMPIARKVEVVIREWA